MSRRRSEVAAPVAPLPAPPSFQAPSAPPGPAVDLDAWRKNGEGLVATPRKAKPAIDPEAMVNVRITHGTFLTGERETIETGGTVKVTGAEATRLMRDQVAELVR